MSMWDKIEMVAAGLGTLAFVVVMLFILGISTCEPEKIPVEADDELDK